MYSGKMNTCNYMYIVPQNLQCTVSLYAGSIILKVPVYPWGPVKGGLSMQVVFRRGLTVICHLHNQHSQSVDLFSFFLASEDASWRPASVNNTLHYHGLQKTERRKHCNVIFFFRKPSCMQVPVFMGIYKPENRELVIFAILTDLFYHNISHY